MRAKPKFTRTHYQAVAEVLQDEYRNAPNPSKQLAGVYRVACALADKFAQDNPRFNATHFLCVVRGEKRVTSRPRSKAHLAVPVVGLSCECSDSNCEAHRGDDICSKPVSTILYRVDMVDKTGTAMCDDCADDASASGLFTTREVRS